MTDIKQTLKHGHQTLKSKSPTARLDAEVLLAHALSTSRTFLYTYPEKEVSLHQLETFQGLLDKRSEGVPIAYLTGVREFWSLPIKVSKDTLIPRPETELLVDLTLTLLANIQNATLLDLGTGSGAIALALASARSDWQLYATDISQAALQVASDNARILKLSNVKWLCSDWFSSVPNRPVHAILSNPPYIKSNDPHLTQGDVRFEPIDALISGEDGLDALTGIIQKSDEKLLPGGLLLLEHGYHQGLAVTTMLIKQGYERVTTWQDAQGHDRVSGGWRKK
ncbi:MAG: peptide chain release factor N(5)-glutamine methyltransferase [Legionellales bacterium]|nr:peptide chain release factor N(5)-glutamine methyltransferase [Legionellales bacterium]